MTPGGGDNGGTGIARLNISPWQPTESGESCGDGADDDADGLVDCHDPDCADSERCLGNACADVDLGTAVPQTVSGRLTPSTSSNRHEGSCQGRFGRDRAFTWQAPATGRYAALLSADFFSVLYARRGTCVGAEIACQRGGATDGRSRRVRFDLDAGERVFLFVDVVDDPYALRAGNLPRDSQSPPASPLLKHSP